MRTRRVGRKRQISAHRTRLLPDKERYYVPTRERRGDSLTKNWAFSIGTNSTRFFLFAGSITKNGISMNPVEVSKLQTLNMTSFDDPAINWIAAFACYGGQGADYTVVVPFSIASGGHLGWHIDSLEETQYIIAGSGELQRDEGSWSAGPGSIFVLPKNVRHDLRNTGTVPLLAVAFFSGEALTQTFDEVMLPVNGHILASPNASA